MPSSALPTAEVVEARPLEGLKLWLRFSDGKEGVVDLSALELPLNGRLTTPGPRLMPRDMYEGKGLKVLVIVEDPNEAGYLKWYWSFLP